MQLGQIEAFLEVAKLGNVRRAAGALYVTQPSLSARLQGLESEIGERLFVRTSHGVRLTEAGRAFLPYAERAMRALREGRGAVRGLREATTGRLTLGAAPAISTYLLPPLLRQFAQSYPSVEIVVRTSHSEELLTMVLKEEVQLGLVRALSHPEIRTLPWHQDELVLVTGPLHPFARREDEVSIQEVGNEGLVFFDRTSSYFELTRALFVEAGVAPRPAMELDNIEAAKKMVEEGLGVALLPRMSVERELALGILAQVPLAGPALPRRELIAIWRADVELSGVARAFLKLVPATEDSLRGGHAAAVSAPAAGPNVALT